MRCASHERVVDLIRSSGSLVTMTVVSQTFPNNFQQQQQVNLHYITNETLATHANRSLSLIATVTYFSIAFSPLSHSSAAIIDER